MRTRHLFISFLCSALFATAAAAQEMPGRRYDGPVTKRMTLAMPQVPIMEFASLSDEKRAAAASEKSGALRVGFVLDAGPEKRAIAWSRKADGGYVWRTAVRSRDAKGLRSRLAISAFAPGIEIRVASRPDGVAEVMPLRADALVELPGEIWTPYTDGDTQYIELATQSDPRGVQVKVAGVVHFEIGLLSNFNPKASGTCNPDVSCTANDAVIDAGIQERKNSVARINFVKGGSSFICTGTLINSDRFPVPFFLTANHCISTQAVASTVTSLWFNEATGCGLASIVPESIQVSGGAQLTFTNYNVDSTLLQLNSMPPDGVSYSGYNAAEVPVGANVVSISHPRGDPTKYALGKMTKQIRLIDYPQSEYAITFSRGVIEGGSSGSGLFTIANGTLQLRGILTGTTIKNGGLSCTNLDEFAVYGRFEIFYPEIKSYLTNISNPADDYGNTIANAADLAVGGKMAGRINYAGDVDVFRINVAQPGNLTVYSTGGEDLVGTLLDSAGAMLQFNDDAESRALDFGLTVKVSPGTYYLNVVHFEPNNVGDYEVHADFSTVTDNYSDIWYTQGEDGWGIALNHQGNILGGALYTYDVDGSNMWLLLNGASKQADGSYSGPLLRFTGPTFNTTPWPVQSVASTQVGIMRLIFTDTKTAQMTYTVNGVPVSKTITRFVYGTPAICTFSVFDRSYTRNLQDIWWTTPEAGWGINLVQQGNIVSAALYTYDPAGNGLWLLLGQGLRTLTETTETFSGDLLRFTGPVFNAAPWPMTATPTKVGTMSLEFTVNNKGKLTYSVNGAQVVKQIERFVFSSPMTSCK